MDAFSQILSGVKLNGAVFFTAEFSAPWGFSTPASNMMAAKIAPGAEHLVLYHLVIEGGAVIELTDGQRTELGPGDVVIFPHGDPHHMSSGNGATRPFPNYGITNEEIAKLHELQRLR
ncbi:MAG: cupin domain-containing protein [Acidobacteria bacterium]|nr:cupin domain-containing protein [Acidobacteriota bacterium]